MKVEDEALLLVTSAIGMWKKIWKEKGRCERGCQYMTEKSYRQIKKWIQASGDFEEGLAFDVALIYNSSKFQVPHIDAL